MLSIEPPTPVADMSLNYNWTILLTDDVYGCIIICSAEDNPTHLAGTDTT